jgi:hypothetical protein
MDSTVSQERVLVKAFREFLYYSFLKASQRDIFILFLAPKGRGMWDKEYFISHFQAHSLYLNTLNNDIPVLSVNTSFSPMDSTANAPSFDKAPS